MSLASLVRWISTIVPDRFTVIQGHPNAPAPSTEYIVLTPVSGQGSAYPIVDKELDDDGNLIRYSAENDTVFSVDIHVFSQDGYDILNDIRNSGSLPSYIDRPVLLDTGTILGPAFFNDSGFSPQHTCNFTFRESHSTTVLDPRVQSISMDGQIDDLGVTIGADIDTPTPIDGGASIDVDIDFTDTDPVSIGTIPAGRYAAWVVVDVTATFDDAALLSVGEITAPARLMGVNQNDLMEGVVSLNDPHHRYDADTEIFAHLSGAATQGTARVVVYYY